MSELVKRSRVHLVCNAHLDPVWLWEWEEGAAEALSTFRTAADLCEEFGAFVFNHNEALLYAWIEEFEPALFARIQRLVKERRWHIMGGWFLQPDCNMPSGESFIRQILLGRRYFSEKFGARPTTAINFDSFGHTRGLVQILAKCGYDSYVHCRPLPDDLNLPGTAYLWEGYDGSRVMAIRPWGWYLSHLGWAREKVEGFIEENPNEPVGLILWGVGDHGGGPSRKDLRDLTELISSKVDVDILHSTPEAFFADLKASGVPLEVHRGDLNPWGVGCYTSMARVKAKHRALENELYAVEKMLSAAWSLHSLAYPQVDLKEALRDLALAEFHDILPGSSIQPAEEMAMRLFDHGLEILSRLKARAFFSLAQGQPRAKEGQIPVLVYNPHPYPVETVVECEFQLADQRLGGGFTIPTVYQNDAPLPTQLEQEASNLALDWRKRVVFRAELAPAQMNRFDCHLDEVDERPRPAQIEGDMLVFSNDACHVEIDFHTGLLERYAVDGVDLLGSGAFKPLVMVDTPDPWGMTMHGWRQVEGDFALLSPVESARFAGLQTGELAPVRIIEDGAVRLVVEALFGYKDSRLVLRYKLPRHGIEIEVDAIVHWNEKDRLLKLAVPTLIPQAEYLGQVAYGVANLPDDGDEAVAQKWVAVANPQSALTIINDRTYGSSFQDGELRLTLLRSPAYAAHPIGDRALLPEERYTPRHDQGERSFRFWMQGGGRKKRLEAVDREASAHNERPMALSFFPNGEGKLTGSFLSLSDPVVQVCAVKKAEEGDCLIIRLFEPTGYPRRTTVSLPFADMHMDVELGKFEILTLKVDWKSKSWHRVSPLETEE